MKTLGPASGFVLYVTIPRVNGRESEDYYPAFEGPLLNHLKIQKLYIPDGYMATDSNIRFAFDSPPFQYEVTPTLVYLVTIPFS